MREGRDYLGEGGIDVAGILNEIPVVPYSIELPNSVRVKELGYEGHAKMFRDSKKILWFICAWTLIIEVIYEFGKESNFVGSRSSWWITKWM